MTTQTARAVTSPRAVPEAACLDSFDHPQLLSALAGFGRRGADRVMTPTLVAYWAHLTRSTPVQRMRLLDDLRGLIRAGDTTARAWAVVALGDHDFEIVRDAVLGFLGGVASVDRRAQATEEAIDWIRRGLSLNCAAVFAALLARADESTVERLTGLRSRMSREEADAIWRACASVESEPTRTFVAEWRGFYSV